MPDAGCLGRQTDVLARLLKPANSFTPWAEFQTMFVDQIILKSL